MSIDEQIEAAWKEYKPEALLTNSMVLSHDVFVAGYLAALRSLYVEVKLEDLEVGETYWVLVEGDGKWHRSEFNCQGMFDWVSGVEGGFTMRYASPTHCEKILKLNLPSPSDIFGRGSDG